MDLKDTPELARLRSEVRDWIAAHLPEAFRRPERAYHGIEESAAHTEWYKALASRGWLAYRWPKQWGGSGFSPAEQVTFVDECRRAGAPVPHGFGISMVGPILMRHGSDWQQERFLKPIAAHTERWCQGYSEPNAGSDLASLQTRAELAEDREHLVVNGQKTWTSAADRADWIFCLVRTDPQAPKHKGIGFLLIDMRSPGVSIRPIAQIDGRAGFFETFFEDVRVPIQNLVGDLTEGWGMAKDLLQHERLATGTNQDLYGMLSELDAVARAFPRGGPAVAGDPGFRHRRVAAQMDADCLQSTRYRMETAFAKGGSPGAESSIFKLYQSELFQRVCDLALEAMGAESRAWYDERLPAEAYAWPMRMTITRAMSIYAGSNEIQRNIIAKRVLGLPD